MQELPRLEMALWTSLTNRDDDDDDDGHINAQNNDGDGDSDGERLKAILWISFGFHDDVDYNEMDNYDDNGSVDDDNSFVVQHSCW